MVLVLLLSACAGTSSAAPENTEKASVENESPEARTPDDEITPEETEGVKLADVELALDTTYVVETIGENDENANGEVIGSCHFQKLVFTNPNAALKKINAEIEEECEEFFSEGSGKLYKEYLSNLSEAEKSGLVKQPYRALYDIENVFIDDKYVSIRYVWDWFAGGVHNFGGYGCTFDITSGEEIEFDDLFASEADAAKAFSDAISKLIQQNPEAFFEDAMDTVEHYDMDDVKFSLNEKTITIYIDQYELAPGAFGSFTAAIDR